MNFFDHKDLGNHLLQLCPKVVKHPVYIYIYIYIYDISNLRVNGREGTRNKQVLGKKITDVEQKIEHSHINPGQEPKKREPI